MTILLPQMDSDSAPVSRTTSTTSGVIPELVVVANRLPMEFIAPEAGGDQGAGTWSPSPGGLVSALAPVLSRRASRWVGWGGRSSVEVGVGPPRTWGQSSLQEVLLEPELVRGFYENFSNACLWPLYHDALVPPAFHRDAWHSYVTANRHFAEMVATSASPRATVWVHDYQLQLVPRMLRDLRPDLRIGFFLHIPFPPVELFARLPWRAAVLDGLLGADVVGFQSDGAVENFVTLCGRLLGVSRDGSGALHDSADGHRVVVGCYPIGIDTARWEALGADPATTARAEQVRRDLGNPSVVLLGVDRLDYTKGIDLRLHAFGELLDEGRLVPGDAVMVQVATPTRENVPGYQEIRDVVELEVGRLNGRHANVGSPAVHYLRQSLDESALSALYLAADVALVTPLRDGMNLVVKEYVACRPDDRGAVVLSEFTGAAGELLTAFQVNPYDVEALKDAIMAAVSGPVTDRSERMAAMRDAVARFDVHRWSSRFMADLESDTPADLVSSGDF